MKKSISLLISIFILIFFSSVVISAAPDVTATAAILIDAETGKILYSKNIHQRRPPASTTKMMTGILAIEYGNLEDEVLASAKAAYEGGSSIYLVPDEKLTLRELVYGLLIKSGNDAAVAIAEHIAGSVDDFAWLMNLKAKEIGALNTTFKNPNGLPKKGHLTTAYDLAQIARYALQNDFFAQVVATPKKRISWPGHNWDRILNNTNKLLRRSDIVDGVKTGYTKAAGRCLVASATKDAQQLISVVLRSNNIWDDSLKLLNYGFDNYKKIRVIKEGELIDELHIGEHEIGLMAAKEFSLVIPRDSNFTLKKVVKVNELNLPLKRAEKVGCLSLYDKDDNFLGKIDLVSDKEVNISFWNRFWRKLLSTIQLYF